MDKFSNRQEAGRLLANALTDYADRSDTVVLGLPRGGIPVAYEVATKLHLPLEVFIVRKLGVPHQPELAMGAIATGGIEVLNDNVIKELDIKPQALKQVIQIEEAELNRRMISYRGNRPPLNVEKKIVILVDDGIATGASIRVAIKALRALHPSKIVIAVPVAETIMCDRLKLIADQVICLLKPEVFYAVGLYYDDFEQTTDEEVHQLLKQASSIEFPQS